MPFDVLHKKLFELDTEGDLLQRLWVNPKTNLLCATSDEFTLVYLFDVEAGTLKKIAKFQTDFKEKEPCQVIRIEENYSEKKKHENNNHFYSYRMMENSTMRVIFLQQEVMSQWSG